MTQIWYYKNYHCSRKWGKKVIYYSCTIVIGFFQSSYTGIERNNSYQIPVGIVSGIPPRGFAILNIDIIPITASKYYFSLDVYWIIAEV